MFLEVEAWSQLYLSEPVSFVVKEWWALHKCLINMGEIYSGSQDWGDDEFLCDNTHQFLKDIRWLGWTSNQYYVSQLFMIPSLWERLDPLFPSKTEVFPQLARLILLPSNDVWKHIEHVYQDYDLDSMVQVGVQVRTLHRKNSEAFDPVIHKQIVDCLLMHKVVL